MAYRPDGKQLAVATLNAHLTFFDPVNAEQQAVIEARHDLGYARLAGDKVTAKQLAAGRFV